MSSLRIPSWEGTDGIALDRGRKHLELRQRAQCDRRGDARDGRREVFPQSGQCRAAPVTRPILPVGDAHILSFRTSPFLSGRQFLHRELGSATGVTIRQGRREKSMRGPAAQ